MKIAFIQPKTFLRTRRRTNPFFDPIIASLPEGCEWTLWLPKGDSETGYDASHVRHYHAVEFWQTWFWRILHLLAPWMSAARVYWLFGKVARLFCRGWADADAILTIACLFADELSGMFPDKRIVDVQHGVIYSRHQGYFLPDGLLIPSFRRYENLELWVYGKGYADSFFKNRENERWLGKFGGSDCRVKVIGDLLNVGHQVLGGGNRRQRRNAIVLMLQFNSSFPEWQLLKMKGVWEAWLEENRTLIEAMDFRVLIRHHPRFGNVVDFSDWTRRFKWAQVDDRSWDEVYDEAFCCVGFNSTTIIEAAGRGVPVVILDGRRIAEDSYFADAFVVDEFNYPFRLSLDAWTRMTEPEKASVSRQLIEWHRKFYASFDERNCLALLGLDSRKSEVSHE